MSENQSQPTKPAASKQRRVSGLIVLLVAFAALALINYKPSIERVHCTEDILRTRPEVVMLGTWWCQYCYQARRYFTNQNITYCEYDIERSAEGEKLYNDINAQVIPVLLVDEYVISGFDEVRLEQLLEKTRQAS